ncbi:MAG: sensor domain-containing diguanylate cyclase [Marinobacterium sp.]|nr:sensor domain-containing diguanylate cyclase [Marinobacterium sp.]
MPDSGKWLIDQPLELIPFAKWQRTVNLMTELFRAPAGFIVQHTEEGYQVAVASEQEENPYGAGLIVPVDANIFCRKIVQSRQELYVRAATECEEWQTNPEVTEDGFNSYLGVPIFWPDGKPFGTICVMDFAITDYDAPFVELIRQFRDLVQADLVLLDHFDLFRELAMKDELTGLYNLRGFRMVAEQRMLLAKSNHTRLALIYLDMNGLKTINDQLGHAAGDQALRLLADSLRQSFRATDVLARIGGDEFLLLAETDDLVALSEHCQAVDTLVKKGIDPSHHISTGVSFGILQMDDLEQPLEHWIARADQAMYEHKKSRPR